MTPQELAQAIFERVAEYAAMREFSLPFTSVEDVTVERPKSRDHGDWATNIALKLSKPWGINPRELAAELSTNLQAISGVDSVEVAGPGFLNFRLDSSAASSVVTRILEEKEHYGFGHLYDGVAFNLEFVSANPTGPIHMGGTRWAAVGDAIARILRTQGAEITSEYYFNDHGSQIDRFARSLLASYLGEAAPEDGYGGAYISDIAQRVTVAYSHDLSLLPREEAQEVFRSIGVELMFGDIKESLHDFGVDFDVYFHEESLHESRAVERAVEKLSTLGHIFEQDGATWLRTTEFGDDKDRVVIKSDGHAAYIAGDLAYYLNKRERGFERNIIMLGADHHGYVARMMAMCAAFGDSPGLNLEIKIGQMVNLVRDGVPVRMSKRAGTVVTLEDLVEAVGVDAGRYALVRSSSDSQLDIDLDLLAKRTNDNPVFYVQYAHARTCAVSRNAEDHSISLSQGFDGALLTDETEVSLMGLLADYPRILSQSAELREPHRIARYIEVIAGAYHRWYDSCRVIPRDGEEQSVLHSSRLALNLATGQVIRNGLSLLGVSAPDRM